MEWCDVTGVMVMVVGGMVEDMKSDGGKEIDSD